MKAKQSTSVGEWDQVRLFEPSEFALGMGLSPQPFLFENLLVGQRVLACADEISQLTSQFA